MRLVDITPRLDATALLPRFRPPRRFDEVRFDTYEPNPSYPSQASARDALQAFAASAPAERRRWFRAPSPAAGARGRYLDGGFGVGKTHLLAALWHAAEGPKAYLTFEELTAFVGFAGMTDAVAAFREHRLICIDEFELDDVANTLLVVSFLRGVLDRDGSTTRVAVTSNTLPDALGQQRFSASEFKREIAAIAAYFDEQSIDGPDFRTAHRPLPLAALDGSRLTGVTDDDFEAVLAKLQRLHPVHYGALLDEVDGVRIAGVRPLRAQDDALLFVQFVDKLYDARIPVRLEGVAPIAVFAPEFRNGGYRKKYGRAESRMAAMAGESAGLL